LARGKNRQVLEESLATIWGEGASWQLREGGDFDTRVAAESTPTEDDPVLKHPLVQTALDIFGGTARALNSDDSKETP